MDKQRIVISRSVKEVQLFDHMPSQFEDWWLTLICHGGSLFDMVFVIAARNGCTETPLDAYRWYPRSLLKTLLLVSAILATFIESCYFFPKDLYFQNTWQTECPEEMVEYIRLDIPLEADVENPTEDDALMARIEAKKICGFTNWFELKNAVTGTRFMFGWDKNADVPKSNFTLRRNQ